LHSLQREFQFAQPSKRIPVCTAFRGDSSLHSLQRGFQFAQPSERILVCTAFREDRIDLKDSQSAYDFYGSKKHQSITFASFSSQKTSGRGSQVLILGI
jgi:hypothetical protein